MHELLSLWAKILKCFEHEEYYVEVIAKRPMSEPHIFLQFHEASNHDVLFGWAKIGGGRDGEEEKGW